MMRSRIEAVGGRRFLMAMGAGITATVVQLYGGMDKDGENYRWIVLGTVGAYIAGNTWQKANATTKSEAEA